MSESKTQTPILPKEGEENILITSALPYVNNVPHLGNIIGCVLSADVFARFCRLRGKNTLFVCGTDEYGTATEKKALEEGVGPKEICDRFHKIHKEVYDWFSISFDHFGRTSTAQQTEIAQAIFNDCNQNGFISRAEEEQWYCDNCQCFLADRFVEGACPNPECDEESARGDQCDKCGQPINARELGSPRCKYGKKCEQQPELRKSTHLYLDLDKLQGSVQDHFSHAVKTGKWSQNAQDITQSWFDRGLKPRAITRDLKWGTPVPLEGFENKVFYVWFDAPIGYVSITANYTDEWEKWWKNPSQVQLYQFMAKDNVLFHSIIFPASLIGTGKGWTKVNHLSATEYLNYEDRQFSKSRGVGVFGNNAQESGVPADVYRFYLLYIRPETADTHFDWADLIAKHNNDLLKNLGNFVHRALTFCKNYLDSTVTETVLTEEDQQAVDAITSEVAAYVDLLEKQVKLRDGLKHILSISRIGNQLIQANEPWVPFPKKKKNAAEQPDAEVDEEKRADVARQQARAKSVISLCVNVAALLAALLKPYLPNVADSLASQLQYTVTRIPDAFECFLPVGHKIGEPETLFALIPPNKAAEWSNMYGGTQKKEEDVPLVELPEDKDALEKLVDEQGTLVREAKAAGVEKADIAKLVQELKRRKSALARLTGETGGEEEKEKKQKKKKKKTKKEGGNGKKEKVKYDGPLAGDLKRLGQEVGQQAGALKTLKKNCAPEDECKAAEDKLNDLKAQLAAIKIKVDAEMKAAEEAPSAE